MKRVLFVVPFLPYPFSSGGHQAIFNGLMAVPDNVELFLAYPSYSEQSDNEQKMASHLNRKITILPYKNHYNPRGEKILDLIYKLKYGIKKTLKGEKVGQQRKAPYEVWLNQLMPKSEGFIRHINSIIADHRIEIIQCEMLESLSLILSFPAGLKTIFVHHELGFVRKGQNPFLSEEPFTGEANVEINKIIEVDLLNRYDRIVTLSSIDTKKLQDAGVRAPIHTSFAIVNTPARVISELDNIGCLSFIGPEWHPSNKEGLLWFLNNCWDGLQKVDSPYVLRVIGNWTEETKKSISRQFRNVEFLGYVDDLEAVIKNTIMIVPITIGSGIRMKILEACMTGVPVVTTSIGKEGLPLENGTHCFVADTPSEFVDAIFSLSDSSICNKMILAAQDVIKHSYSLEALRDNRATLYQ